MNKNPHLIGSAEAAAIVAVDRATFNRWVKTGRVRAEQEFPGITGPRLFLREDIERFAAEYREGKPLKAASA